MENPSPRLYLDTNVLVSAILESKREWYNAHLQEPEKWLLIQYSRRVYDEKDSLKLMTSVFSIAEFMAQGRKQEFGKKDFGEMLDIVNSKILPPNLEIIYNSLSFQQTPKINRKWKDHWLFAELKAKGNAIDEKGKSIGVMDFWYLLDLWGRLTKGWGGGLPREVDAETFNPKLTQINISSYSAPAFEMMLFYEATKIAIDVGLKLPDAIHILCAKGKADILVTNDQKFVEKCREKPRRLGIRVKSSQETWDILRRLGFA